MLVDALSTFSLLYNAQFVAYVLFLLTIGLP